MATSGENGRYEFTEKIPNKFVCPVCLDAVYDAVETKCCGVLLCMQCSDRLIASMMACPQCRQYPLAVNASHFVRREVRQLHIYCVNKDCCSTIKSCAFPVNPNAVAMREPIVSGLDLCKWSGEINDLQSHLDNHCPHTTVTCQYNCGAKIFRCQKDVHEAKICCKRPFFCWFCNMKATAEEINSHASKCDKQPIECPNKCPAKLLLRELQLHLEQCPLQEIPCEFEHAGCKMKVLHKDYDSHIEDNTQKHLRLMSSHFATLKHENEQLKQKLDEQNKENEQLTQEQIGMKKEVEIMKTKIMLLSQLQAACLRTKINIRIARDGASNPFYVLGYCMTIEEHGKESSIFADAIRSTYYGRPRCNPQYASLQLHIHPGKYDDILSWPLEGKVALLFAHPEDSSKNTELVYCINKIQQPTKPTMIAECLMIRRPEYKLSVQSVILY